jgi:hypothetical protein
MSECTTKFAQELLELLDGWSEPIMQANRSPLRPSDIQPDGILQAFRGNIKNDPFTGRECSYLVPTCYVGGHSLAREGTNGRSACTRLNVCRFESIPESFSPSPVSFPSCRCCEVLETVFKSPSAVRFTKRRERNQRWIDSRRAPD